MAVLPNNMPEALQAIKDAIGVHLENNANSGNVWRRIKYADNLTQWLQVAAVRPVGEAEVVRVAFIYLSGFTSERQEARQKRITATFTIEVIQGFAEGTDEVNSTLIYETYLGELWEMFKNDNALGFTDQASQSVENLPLDIPPGDDEGKPQYVDGVLAHRKLCSLVVNFRLC